MFKVKLPCAKLAQNRSVDPACDNPVQL
uniref:Uncharacterized protein n=1 Tax=Arundo donax TaxID=35708 RepID=A0A0A8ZF98_ARUDO